MSVSFVHRNPSQRVATVYIDEQITVDDEEINSEQQVVLQLSGKGCGFITFYDDGDQQATFSASNIDDLIEALTLLKGELK